MKAKRFLSVFVAILMMVSCFAVSASAEVLKENLTKVTLSINLFETNDKNDVKTDASITGEQQTVTDKEPINAVTFKLYKLDDSATEIPDTLPTDYIQTNATTNGVVNVEITKAQFGRYAVIMDQDTATGYMSKTNGAYAVPFIIDLPLTNSDGDAYLETAYVYPKVLVTGAVEFTKTFNGSTTIPDGVEATFVLEKKVENSDTWTQVGDSFTVSGTDYTKQIAGLAFGTYRFRETAITGSNDYKTLVTGTSFEITQGGSFDNGTEVGTVVKDLSGQTDINNVPSSVPKVTKTVKSSTDSAYTTSASIDVISGENANWKIEAGLPADIYSYYKYVITDQVDTAKLSNPENVVVKAYKGDAEVTTLVEGTNWNTTNENGLITVTLDLSTDGKKAAFGSATGLVADKIVVTFDTSVTAVADRIPNDVEVAYTNTSGTDGAIDNNGGTPNDEPVDPDNPPTNPEGVDPYVYTGKIDVVKVEKGTSTTIDGVTFALYKDVAGTKTAVTDAYGQAVTATTDNGGQFSFSGLENGTYYLRETATVADKYELIGSDISFTVGETALDAKFATEAASHAAATTVAYKITAGGVTTNYIVNIPETDLPLTGGVGTTMFAILGIAFVAVGGTFLFKSKKAKNVA